MDVSTSAQRSVPEERLRFVQLLPDAALVLDAAGAISAANTGACALLGRDPSALFGVTVRSLVSSPAAKFERYLGACWRAGTAIPGAATFRRSSGEVRCELLGGVLGPAGSSAPGLLLRLQVKNRSRFALLTEKVDALTAEISWRREAEARLQSTVNGLPVAVCVYDAAGRFVLTNTTFRSWFRPVPSDPVGLLPDDALAPRAAALVESGRRAREPGTASELMIGVGDEARHVLVERFDAGMRGQERLHGSVWIDITSQRHAETERERMYASVLHAQKLESLGVLAGGIAHDFNNLLVAIVGNMDLAVCELDTGSPARPLLSEASIAAERAAELCQQMLAYSGKGRFVVRSVDMNEVVREMSALLDVSISKSAALEWKLAPEVAPIQVDVTQLRQVVMNLITNASDAIGSNEGVITIGTGTSTCPAEYLAAMDVGVGLEPGLYTWLEISDTGMGMDAETRLRIFDPFFTTKFTGRGLGLAAVLGIVRGHKAALGVYSEPGRGTTFKVLFPVSGTAAEAPSADAEQGPRAQPGHETVLVVDDESAVRGVAKRILSDAGFQVLLAADGEEALRICAERPDVRVVLLDMAMPRMSGEEAFRRLRAARPDVRVVLCSGYSEQDAADRFAGEGPISFLHKPYRAAELVDVVRRALAP